MSFRERSSVPSQAVRSLVGMRPISVSERRSRSLPGGLAGGHTQSAQRDKREGWRGSRMDRATSGAQWPNRCKIPTTSPRSASTQSSAQLSGRTAMTSIPTYCTGTSSPPDGQPHTPHGQADPESRSPTSVTTLESSRVVTQGWCKQTFVGLAGSDGSEGDRAFHRKGGVVCFFMARTPHRARLAAPGAGASRGGFVRRRADRATATRS